MKKNVFTLLFILIYTVQAQINTDTIWFDSDWQITTKSDAEYFRPPVVKENYWYSVKDYFITGELQMEAHSVTGEKDEFDGNVKWYDKSGNWIKKSNYKSGMLEGESINIINGKKYKAIYKNNRFYSGTIIYKNGGGFYKVEGKSGNWTNQKTFFDENHKHLRMESFYYEKDSTSLSNDPYKILYYDFEGNEIGEINYDENQIGNGEYVYYFEGENSHHVKSVHHVKNGRTTYTEFNYPNGNPKIKGRQSKNLIMTYFNENGDVLDSLIIKDNYPYEGCRIVFSTSYDKNGHYLKEKSWYAKGNVTKRIEYYPNGTEAKIIEFGPQFNLKTLEIEKDSNGAVVNQLVYKDGRPFEGATATKYEKKVYKNGKQTEWIEYYKDGITIFKHQKNNLVKFYSLKNELIGELKKDTTMWGNPIEGKKFSKSDDKIHNITEYRNSSIVKETNFDFEDDLIFKREVYYKKTENNYNNKQKEIAYYSNGNIREEIFYSKGYTRTKANFYNTKGDLISTYSYKEKDGVDYEFFNKSDIIRSMKAYENGELVKEKKYKKHYKKFSSDEFEIILIQDIDIDSKAIFYDDSGKVLSELTFKNRKPYTGTAFDEYGNKSIQFLEGVKHGESITYRIAGNYKDVKKIVHYVNGKKEGLQKTYSYSGNLEKTEMFVNDELNGEVISYLRDGSQTKVIYKNGKPYEGEIAELRYGKTSVLKRYNGGELVNEIKYLERGNIEYLYNKDRKIVNIFYPKSEVIKYSIQQDNLNDQLTGEVIRFNKKGKEMHKALLENNKLVSGEIWLGSTNSYSAIPDDHCLKVVKTDESTDMKMFGESNQLIFSLRESNDSQFSIVKRKLNFSLDYITEENLY